MPDDSDKAFLEDQIRERIRYYRSLTDFGTARRENGKVAGAGAGAGAGPAGVTRVEKRDESLDAVRAHLGDCTRCPLHEKRTQIVFGVGNPHAALMFIGEGPGHEEDRQGIPFVGAAGQLLTKIILAIDLARDDVYIANVVKCRPPNNRDPEPEEVEACRPFLDRQIDAVRPRVICALGRVAAVNLLRTDEGITRLRGRVFPYRGAKLVPTYHPAFLLRNPAKKRECWEDMKLVRRLLDEHA